MACSLTDLSPTEHAWDEMQRRLRCHNQHVTLAELSRALIRIWDGIPKAFFQQFCRVHVASVPGMHHCQWWTYAILTLRTGLGDTLCFLYLRDEMVAVMTIIIELIFDEICILQF